MKSLGSVAMGSGYSLSASVMLASMPRASNLMF